MKTVTIALCAILLAGCSEAEMKADAEATEKMARAWCDRMGIRVKGLEGNWTGHCTLVTETEVGPRFCPGDRGRREIEAKGCATTSTQNSTNRPGAWT